MYYHLEKFASSWLSTGLILQGSFHDLCDIVERARLKYGCDFRCKPVTEQQMLTLRTNGMKLVERDEEICLEA